MAGGLRAPRSSLSGREKNRSKPLKHMADLNFVHLHVHSNYSLLEGALPIARLAELAKADHQPALALTDTDNMFGALEFSEKLARPASSRLSAARWRSTSAMRPRPAQWQRRARAHPHCVCCRAPGRLPQPDAAVVARLPRFSAQRAATAQARLARRRNRRHHRAHRRPGRPARCGHPPPAKAISPPAGLTELLALFCDRLYVELQRHGTANEKRVEPVLIDLAYAKSIPLVATNEPYFATAQDHEAHDALICIAEGRMLAESDRRQLNAEHRFKSARRNGRAVCRPAEALASTVEIAERCAFRRARTSRSCRASRWSAAKWSTSRRIAQARRSRPQ